MKYFLSIIFSLLIVLPVFAGSYKFEDNSGLKTTATQTGHTALTGIVNGTPAEVAGKIIQLILSFLGVIFLILMIYGGFLWMTAQGNDNQIEKARNIIKNSIIGLVIILSAYAITAFLGNELSSWNVGDNEITEQTLAE